MAAIAQSLNEIVRRHEVLRTTFEMVEGQPIQVIRPNLTLTLPAVNLCQLPEPEQKREVQRLTTEHSQQPFDLVQGPLLRWMLLQLGQQDYILLFTVHHIVFDGWSIGVLFREITTLYKAFSTGQPSPLPELPIQYADFAAWQRQGLHREVLNAQLAYWKQQLKNLPILHLPTDRPRPAVRPGIRHGEPWRRARDAADGAAHRRRHRRGHCAPRQAHGPCRRADQRRRRHRRRQAGRHGRVRFQGHPQSLRDGAAAPVAVVDPVAGPTGRGRLAPRPRGHRVTVAAARVSVS